MSETFQGRRVIHCSGHHALMSGEFCKSNDVWHAATPNGLPANLANHEVTEHADGTISVSSSIEVTHPYAGGWRGYLEHGVWRAA